MFANQDAAATVLLNNIKPAGILHESRRGLRLVRADETGVRLPMDESSTIRIESANASTRKASQINWAVGDEIDGMLQALNSF